MKPAESAAPDHGAIAVERLEAAIAQLNVQLVYDSPDALYGIGRPGVWAGKIEGLIEQLPHRHRVAIRRAAGRVAAAVLQEPQAPRNDGARSLDRRPEIRLGPDVHWNVRRSVDALADRPDLYQRGGCLVRVVEDRVLDLSGPALQVHLSSAAIFLRLRADPSEPGRMVPTPVEPPLPLARSIADHGTYPGVRELVGVTRTPVLRDDGTIVITPGYDAETKLVYYPDGDPPQIPSSLTRDDAVAAAKVLLGAVHQFPFLSDADRSAWLSLVLTLACRNTIQGATPLFLLTANQARLGKTTLGEYAATCAGVPTAPSKWPEGVHGHEELGKRIDGWINAATPLALLDNIRGTISGTALEAAITSYPFYQLRVLGESAMPLVPQRTVIAGTGNGAVVGGDMAGRTLPIRLYWPKAKPETRSFEQPNLRAWITEQRKKLHAAALTIVSAYLQSGDALATQGLWGSFESWTQRICGAIEFCDLPDPRETRANMQQIDQSGGLHDRLVTLIKATLTGDWTAGQLADRLASTDAASDFNMGDGWTPKDGRQLAAELNVWEPTSRTVNRRALGELLSRIVDRPSLEGLRITHALEPLTGLRKQHATKVALYTLETA